MISDLKSGYRYVVSADFAMELERELNGAKSRVQSLLEYAYHAPTCPMPAKACDCGLIEILDSVDRK